MMTKKEMPEAKSTVKRQYIRPEVRRVRLDPAQSVLSSCNQSNPVSQTSDCAIVAIPCL